MHLSLRFFATLAAMLICFCSCQDQEFKAKVESVNSSMLQIEKRAKDIDKLNENELTDFQNVCKNGSSAILEINEKTDDPNIKHKNDKFLVRISEILKAIDERIYCYQNFKSTESEVLRSIEGEWSILDEAYVIRKMAYNSGSASYTDFSISGSSIVFHEEGLQDIVGKIQLDSELYFRHTDEKNNNTKKGMWFYSMTLINCEAADKFCSHPRLLASYEDGKLKNLSLCQTDAHRISISGDNFNFDARSSNSQTQYENSSQRQQNDNSGESSTNGLIGTEAYGGIIIEYENGHGLVASKKSIPARDLNGNYVYCGSIDDALKKVKQYSEGGYRDWFLPNNRELLLISKAFGVMGEKHKNQDWAFPYTYEGGGYISSESTQNDIMIMHIPLNEKIEHDKPDNHHIYGVCAVRRF